MIFLYLLTEGDRFVIDMCQSIKFWSEKVPTKYFQAVFYKGTSDKSAIKSQQT